MTLCLTLRRRIKRTHWEDSVQAVWLHSWAFIKLQHRYVLFKRTLNHLEAEMLFDLSVVMILLHHSLLPFCVDITTALANRFTSVLKKNHVSSLLIIKPTLFLWSIERCDFRSSITVKLSLSSVKPQKPQNLPGSEKPAKQLPSTFVFKTQLCPSDSSVKIVIRVSWDSLLKDITQLLGSLDSYCFAVALTLSFLSSS